MPPRNVLLVTYYFPPSAAVAVYRLIALCRHLPRHGWRPVVVTAPNPPWELEDPALRAQVPADTPVTVAPFAGGLGGKLLRRAVPQLHWLPFALTACASVIRQHKIAAVITTSPPGEVHLVGMRLKARYGLPWLADFRDPWIANHRAPLTLKRRLSRFVEGRVMRKADALIANTPLNQEGWAKAYPFAAGKIVTITNGFDPERFDRTVTVPPHDGLSLLHAGEIYAGRDPRPLLDALAGMRDAKLHLTLLGRSTENLFDLPAEIRNRSLEAVVALEAPVPYAESLARMSRTDVLLLLQSPGYRIGVPAKLYEYLGTGRPILALAEPDGDIAWVLRESGVLHRVARPDDPPAIRRAIRELADAIASGAPSVGDEAALAGFTRERMAQRFAERLDAVTP